MYRRYRRRTSRRRRPTTPKRLSKWRAATRLSSGLGRTVTRGSRSSGEVKYMDTAIKGSGTPLWPAVDWTNIVTTMSNNSFVEPLNTIQRGTSDRQRVGSKIQMLSLQAQLEFHVTWPSVGTGVVGTFGRSLRVCIVYDRQPDGSLPVKSDIFRSEDQQDNVWDAWNSPPNTNNRHRFAILLDRKYVIHPNVRSTIGATDTLETETKKNVKIYKKLNLGTQFSATSNPSTVSDIATGALYIIAMSDVPTGATPSVEGSLKCDGVCRLAYKD